MKKEKVMHLRVDNDSFEKIKKEAKEKKMNISEYIRYMLNKVLGR